MKDRHDSIAAARRDAPAPMRTDIVRGALLGSAFGAAFALGLDAPGAGVVFAAALGCPTGAVTALMVWLGSAELPEDRIPPVRTRRANGEGPAPR